VTVRPVTSSDSAAWLRMRCALWPSGREAEHREEIERFLGGGSPREPREVLLAEDSEGGTVGFVELSIRPYAKGCRTRRVAYLEGWFVLPEARGRGVGRALVTAAEEWARARGSSEFASDTEPGNEIGEAAHLAVGFADAGAVRCFRKEI